MKEKRKKEITPSRSLFQGEDKWRKIILIVVAGVFVALAALYPLYRQLEQKYEAIISPQVFDRNGERVAVLPNIRGDYATLVEKIPKEAKELTIQKEDRWFYFHPGVNLLSLVRSLWNFPGRGRLSAVSTITQQTVRVLLGHENSRSIFTRLTELPYVFALEVFNSKENILKTYLTVAPLGNQTEGIAEASEYYFGTRPENLTTGQTLAILAGLNNPTSRAPGTPSNQIFLPKLARSLGIELSDESLKTAEKISLNSKRSTDEWFELQDAAPQCVTGCVSTIDADLTKKLRDLLKRELDSPWLEGVKQGAIAVIKLGHEDESNQLLALVGSPSPQSEADGMQIDMGLTARPVGSTLKTLIYTKAFEAGARPYTLVDDLEYRYPIGTGFALYPKNYDGEYHGRVTLHYSLANSLNVPAVKTLEFEGLENFQKFMLDELEFLPRQPLESYGLGLALGGLEMNLLTLINYVTILPREGMIYPLLATSPVKNGTSDGADFATLKMMKPSTQAKRVAEKGATQLVTRILSDRASGVEEFGAAGNLFLTIKNYAVKTGTTYDYHDSWTVGFTPDFAVGVWLGNADNSPVRQLSGQAGAGRVWHDAMQMLINTPYYTKTPLNFSELTQINSDNNLEYGLVGDDYKKARDMMIQNRLIISPHDGDQFALNPLPEIPLRASRSVKWSVNKKDLGEGSEVIFKPAETGEYELRAEDTTGQIETIRISINKD